MNLGAELSIYSIKKNKFIVRSFDVSYTTLQGVWGYIVLISLYIGLLERVNINNTRLEYYMACYITWGSSGRECIVYKKKWMGNPIGTCSLLKRKLVALK